MLTATLRGMLTHKLRLVLTTTSIALGVAFLAGTLMLTDTMKVAFHQLFGKVSSGTDAVVRQESAYAQSSGVGVSRTPVPASLLTSVRAVNGVAAAEGSVSGYALLTDQQGKAVTTKGGAPTMGYSMSQDTVLRGDVRLRSGRAPQGAHEVAIDASSAEKHSIALGSRIAVLFRGPTERFTVVGTVGYGSAKDLGGTSAAYFDGTTAQRVLGRPGAFDEIRVRATDGLSDAALAHRLRAALPDGYEAVTGATVADEASDAINDQFGFLNVMFLSFAGIALFVGSFIIWNTFSMIVTQRSREIALFRAIGATRRQVKRSLVIEAAVLGVSASAVGVVLGAGVAKGLNALMGVLGFSLPSTSLQIAPRTIWVSMVVGTVVTVLSAMVPARRATKVLPVEALRDATPGAKRPSRVRAVLGAVVTTGGVIGIVSGLRSGTSSQVMLGILATAVGVITLTQVAARPLAALLGAPLRWRGVPGELARQNAMRNPRRTASTATALMIGLTLVVSMGVFASSFKASISPVLSTATDGDLYVAAASSQAEGYSPAATRAVAAVPGVAWVSPSWWGEARVGKEHLSFSSVDPATVAEAFKLKAVSGSAEHLDDKGVLVGTGTAKAHGWKVGDAVPVQFAATGIQRLQVRGIIKSNRILDSELVITQATQEANQSDRLDGITPVRLDPGADVGAVKDRITAALATHPDAKVMDREEFGHEIGGFVDSLLALVTAMLLLAVVIALLGIVNTMALSVFERTRELGLLRAVGMTRKQVRSMIRLESVVISLIGAVLGAGLGIGLGIALARALKSDGVTELSVPVGSVLLYVVAAAVAGVLAAVGPGRSAAKVDVLRAVITE